jgi:hypothetical protein
MKRDQKVENYSYTLLALYFTPAGSASDLAYCSSHASAQSRISSSAVLPLSLHLLDCP